MTVERLRTVAGLLVPASLISTITARWFATEVGLATLQMWLMAAALMSLPFYLYLLLRALHPASSIRRSVGLAIVATLPVGLIIAFGFSFLVMRSVSIDERICARPELRRALLKTVGQKPVDSVWNVITVTAPPDVGRDARGDIHVAFDIEWQKKDTLPLGHVWSRTYVGRIYLVSKARDTDSGRRCNDSFGLKDFSLGPKQYVWAYLLGWFEAPFVMSEADMISHWLQRALGSSDGCTIGEGVGPAAAKGGT